MHSSDGKSARGGEAELNTFKEMLGKVIRAPTWKTQVTPNGRHSLECDPNKFHFTMNNDELVFAAITAKDYPIRLAFQMISAVQQEVVPKFGSKALTCREVGLCPPAPEVVGERGTDVVCAVAAAEWPGQGLRQAVRVHRGHVRRPHQGGQAVGGDAPGGRREDRHAQQHPGGAVQHGEDGGRGAEDE
ncbi:unnamed protein product [Phytophthora fragariaefolia]|uniref:Unnamed protein product n=1 Tax=Phytophthora fragariaefolia TaxID=1490495 RepID=A0A9W7CM78_9STRA|nr:unnamed protein product [Phytophthora fragariaefolia]